MPVGWKLLEEEALKWPETSLFRRAVYITSIIEKLIITHQGPIEGIKAWILLGYPSNILGSNTLQVIQVNTVITLPSGN